MRSAVESGRHDASLHARTTHRQGPLVAPAFGEGVHLADPHEIDALRHDDRFGPSPHHGDRGWLALGMGDVGSVDWVEVAELLASAYLQVAPRGPAQRK